MISRFDQALDWYCDVSPSVPAQANLSSTRDIFQARLDTLYQEITAGCILSEDEAALVVAIAGEIGNNCFDHNLGQWPDVIGCWYSWTSSRQEGKSLVVIADRGQGILSSLKRVKPDLATEKEALKIAFEKRLSGRSPEQRGNGLKFVRSVINGNLKRSLLFFSGSEMISFGGNHNLEKEIRIDRIKKKKTTGTLAFISWEKQ